MSSVKIVLIGDGCTGKSTFFDKLKNLNNDEYRFSKKYNATDNFNLACLNLDTNEGVKKIDLWDTAGQENRGGTLRDAYLKGADGVLLFYDVTEKKSVDNITKWLEQIKKITPNVPVAVIGNKSDLFEKLSMFESVKLRECNLQRDIGHKFIKNFLVSIKTDSHFEFVNGFFSSSVQEKDGCLVGLDYILSIIYNNNIVIK